MQGVEHPSTRYWPFSSVIKDSGGTALLNFQLFTLYSLAALFTLQSFNMKVLDDKTSVGKLRQLFCVSGSYTGEIIGLKKYMYLYKNNFH